MLSWLNSFCRNNNWTFSHNDRWRFHTNMTNRSCWHLAQDFWLMRLHLKSFWMVLQILSILGWHFLISKFKAFHNWLCITCSSAYNLSNGLFVNNWCLFYLPVKLIIIWIIKVLLNIFWNLLRRWWAIMLLVLFFYLFKIIFVFIVFSRFLFLFNLLKLREWLSKYIDVFNARLLQEIVKLWAFFTLPRFF